MNLKLKERNFSTESSPETQSGDSKSLDVSESLEFRAGFGIQGSIDLDGFNEYGVRENYTDETLQSVDVLYEAMEPGPPEDRNGIRITASFLETVAAQDYGDNTPYMLGHSDDPLDEIGKLQNVVYDEQSEKLLIVNRVFNTGAPTHDEVVSRLTYEPPTMTDGSVGFGDQYEAVINEAGEPELVDGRIREFSTTPFPGGYDDGGLGVPNAEFAEAIEDAAFDQHGEGDAQVDPEYRDEVYSKWDSLVNMSNEQMEMWDEHPCADSAMDDSENIRDETLMLLGSPKESWRMSDVEVANKAASLMMERMEDVPENPAEGGEGTCPSQWAISLLNRGHNPFDSFPKGNPQFSREVVDVTEFDEEGTDTVSPSEDSADYTTETISL